MYKRERGGRERGRGRGRKKKNSKASGPDGKPQIEFSGKAIFVLSDRNLVLV